MPEFLIGRILVAYLLYLKLRFVCVDGVGWWGGGGYCGSPTRS
jgi:hypothetical protein